MSMSDHDEPLYGRTGAWRRWEPTSFDNQASGDAAASADVAENEAAVALPDPEELLAEIERLREAARVRGHAEGYAEGHTAGMDAGLKEGLEQGLREGRETGYAEGFAQGSEAARLEVERLDALLQSTAESVGRIEAETGEALLGLAMSIARQVLRSTLDAEPERILELVREVVHADGEPQGLVQLRLHPEDVSLVEEYLRADGSISRWTLHADESVERGGCIVTTALGSIDATLQTRWERVISGLGFTP